MIANNYSCDVSYDIGGRSWTWFVPQQQSARVPTSVCQRSRFFPRREVSFYTISLISYFLTFFSLFSRFTISATAQHYVRVSSATLESINGNQGPSIFGTLSQTREIVVRVLMYSTASPIANVPLDYHPCSTCALFVQTCLTIWPRLDPLNIL